MAGTGEETSAVTGGRGAHTGRPVAARPHLFPVPDRLPGRPTSDPGGVVYVKLCNFRFMAEGVIG